MLLVWESLWMNWAMLSALPWGAPREPIIVDRTPCTIPVKSSVFRTSSGPVPADWGCCSPVGGVGVGPEGWLVGWDWVCWEACWRSKYFKYVFIKTWTIGDLFKYKQLMVNVLKNIYYPLCASLCSPTCTLKIFKLHVEIMQTTKSSDKDRKWQHYSYQNNRHSLHRVLPWCLLMNLSNDLSLSCLSPKQNTWRSPQKNYPAPCC